MNLTTALARARGEGQLRDLDLHFARELAALVGDPSPALQLAATLTSAATGAGHICLDLTAIAGRPLVVGEYALELSAPPLAEWRAALRASPAVGAPGSFAPLILDAADRLYLGRFFAWERQVAEQLLALATPVAEVDLTALGAGLQRHFPGVAAGDRQRLAAALSQLRRLTVIAGGPGTGKTTTVARLLALSVELAPRRPRILLAAPTGKAAARLAESLRGHLEQLPPAIREQLPQEAMTLHRLLGFIPGGGRPRHHADNPLHLDLLVVDEVSMVDLPLMARLLAALPPQARLVLLGDPDQLASVEPGSVLGDICQGALRAGYSAPLRRQLHQLGSEPPADRGEGRALADSLVFLTESRRFGAASGIGRLARAINRGAADEALAVLADGQFTDVVWRELPTASTLAEWIGQAVITGYRAYLQEREPAAALAAFNRFRLLCALREGPSGVVEVNRLAEQALRRAELIHGSERFYLGRPLLITRNDHAARLYNGDIGLVLADAEAAGRPRVFFPTVDGGVRRVLINRLPEHETVFAMTIHKSQGSEFERCLLLLPEEENRILTRELLYTGVTRARTAVELWGSEAVWRQAVSRVVARTSGFPERLWGDRATTDAAARQLSLDL